MHGRAKVYTSDKQEALKKKERSEKLARYKAGTSIIFQKRKDQIYDDELMKVTECILLQNPDIYTLWNVRREAFVHNNWDKEVLEEFYNKELILTERCLKESPKSYYIWHQRSWIMNRLAEPDWKKELMLCSKCLDLDERNFHCWDYREFVVQRAGISATEEFEFATKKILNNFSNYSSWHYRSRLLTKIFYDCDQPNINEKKNHELDLVMNATFTDPSDSSAWFYQRWLLDASETSSVVQRVLAKENFIILSLNQCLSTESIILQIDNENVDVEWRSPRQRGFSKLWLGNVKNLKNFNNAKEVQIKLHENICSLTYSEEQWIYQETKTKHNYNEEQLLDQLKSYKLLAEMEPNNKWALLTGTLLMRKIDSYKFHDNILENLNALLKVDPLRFNYYDDLRSKYIVEHKLYELLDGEKDVEMKSKIDLSGLDLTTLSNNENLGFCVEINLGANSLALSLHQLSLLQICEKLSLSSNELENLKNFPTLPNLRVLSLRNNKLCNLDEILELLRRHKLMMLDLRQNPVCETEALRARIMEINQDLKLYVD